MRRGALPFDPTPETEEDYELARSLLKESFAAWGVANAKELETDAGEAPIHSSGPTSTGISRTGAVLISTASTSSCTRRR